MLFVAVIMAATVGVAARMYCMSVVFGDRAIKMLTRLNNDWRQAKDSTERMKKWDAYCNAPFYKHFFGYRFDLGFLDD